MSSAATPAPAVVARPHPPAMPHGSLERIFEGIYMVTGSACFTVFGCCKCAFSRNMQVICQPNAKTKTTELILVNTVRLSEQGLQELDALGTVTHIIRIAGFHGMDDPFYKERYPQATVWTIEENVPYFPGLDAKASPYFAADKPLSSVDASSFPIQNAELIVIESKKPKDGVLLLHRPEGKIFLTGDSLQNFETCQDGGFNLLGKCMMTMSGFIHPCQVGPAWKKAQSVPKDQIEKLLKYQFDHLLPAHGRPVVGQAWKKYQPVVDNW